MKNHEGVLKKKLNSNWEKIVYLINQKKKDDWEDGKSFFGVDKWQWCQ